MSKKKAGTNKSEEEGGGRWAIKNQIKKGDRAIKC
jgi:hypothetical protein